MGRASLEGMLDIANLDSTVVYPDIASILSWHLRSNHYPPVPVIMVRVCQEAIDAANRGAWDEEIDLPTGVTYRDATYAPVRAIITQHHLESFLSGGDDD